MTITDDPRSDAIGWYAHATLEKWHDSARHDSGAEPDEVLELPKNLLLNAGITRMLNLLIGAGGTAFNNTNSRIGVGDSTTAAAATQTDLQAATNKYYMTMDATFPSVSGQTVTFKSTFGSAVANFAWQEWGIDNGTTANTTGVAPMLNRRVTSMGTKASGATWVLTVTITVS
jgi:hypothetical protein